MKGVDGDSKSRRPDEAFSPAQVRASPTSAGASGAAPPSKKKFGLFAFKSAKDHDRTESSGEVAATSPLPPMTPTKAMQLLGVDSDEARNSGDTPTSPSEMAFRSRLAKSKEEDVEPDTPKKLSFWGSNKKALKLLDMRSSRQAKHAEQEYAAASPYPSPAQGAEHSFDTHPAGGPQGVATDSSTNPQPSRRRRHKKGPKLLDKMSPITERSHDALNYAYRNIESNTVLDVIAEYESPSAYTPRNAPFLPRSQAESAPRSLGPFELDERDISPSDREPAEDDQVLRPGSQANPQRFKENQRSDPLWRSPLQRYESRLLDGVEDNLTAQQANVDRHQAAKLELDDEVAVLRRSHHGSMREFEAVKQQALACGHADPASQAKDSDDDDQVSLRSSVDLTEEPVESKAGVETCTLATGHVKEIVIVKRNENVARLKPHCENSSPVSPTHARNTSYNRLTKVSKSKMPRDESQLLVQDWVAKCLGKQQRPVSECNDPDVLADQEIPPAPFPKEEPVSPHPPRTCSRHHCYDHGHQFQFITLRLVPEKFDINGLEDSDESDTDADGFKVRPHPQTHADMQKHVPAPVSCARCGEDIVGGIWECEVPMCGLVVCSLCVVNLQLEREARAAAAAAASSQDEMQA